MFKKFKSKSYCVFYERDNSDCEPELLNVVASLAEAWEIVRECAIAAHNGLPDLEPSLTSYAILQNREAMKKTGVIHAFFNQPSVIADNAIVWIAVSGMNTYFVFGGDVKAWDTYQESKFNEFLEQLDSDNLTAISGV